MNLPMLFLASAAATAMAPPLSAQSMQGMDHGAMPGMKMPPKPAAKAKPKPAQKPATAAKPKPPARKAVPKASVKPAPSAEESSTGCTAEHAAMGHCTLEKSPATPGMADMPRMKMGGAPVDAAAVDPECPPEHAKMGHCTPKASLPEGAPEATGTDLPPGNAPAPAPPGDWYADRIYSGSEMDASRDQMMKENGAQTLAFISFNIAEYQVRNGRDGFRWDGEGWYGGDINRVTVKSEGEGTFGEGVEEAEVQLLYSRAIDPYFNLQTGVRQDLGPGPKRTYATVGFEGLAPYWFEVEGALFLSNKGDVLGRLEGYYDQRITQRLILQPRVEANFALQDVPEGGIGSGLSDVELGLRLRYEIVKEFAPYIGVEWAKKTGDTARFARAAGEDTDVTSFVAGIRFWF